MTSFLLETSRGVRGSASTCEIFRRECNGRGICNIHRFIDEALQHPMQGLGILLNARPRLIVQLAIEQDAIDVKPKCYKLPIVTRLQTTQNYRHAHWNRYLHPIVENIHLMHKVLDAQRRRLAAIIVIVIVAGIILVVAGGLSLFLYRLVGAGGRAYSSSAASAASQAIGGRWMCATAAYSGSRSHCHVIYIGVDVDDLPTASALNVIIPVISFIDCRIFLLRFLFRINLVILSLISSRTRAALARIHPPGSS